MTTSPLPYEARLELAIAAVEAGTPVFDAARAWCGDVGPDFDRLLDELTAFAL